LLREAILINKKILVVEDDRSSLTLLIYALGQEGYKAIAASDGFAGLKIVKDEHPDLIILDVMLPGLDGYEICRRLRQQPQTATVPIIFLSARAGPNDKAVGLRMGANAYITKPADPSMILAKVETLLAGVSETTKAKT
jgi:two-component system, OmpR family, alkaline phosphatase synthesis response regulator PhoP